VGTYSQLKGILSQVNSSGAFRKSTFNGAMSIKKANVPVIKNVVDSPKISKIKQATGGHLRVAISGGAARSRKTQEFLTLARITVLQGAISSSHFGPKLTNGQRLRYDRDLWRNRDDINSDETTFTKDGWLRTGNETKMEPCR
jgi:long-chain acyl-CoA synthetase